MYMLDTKIAIMDNKESSNLLQHSENLSLSDLELPEIEHQRKRKVRRKTRPKLPTGRQRIESTTFGHRNIILLGTVFFITSCWLLILSYTMSVIHIENQRLQSEIKKVRVILNNNPHKTLDIYRLVSDPQYTLLNPKMESGLQISLPIKTGAKKIRKRRELDALVSYSIARRNDTSKPLNPKGKHSLEKLIRTSTDDQDDCNLETNYKRVDTCHVRNSNVPIRMCAPLIVVIVIIILFGFVHWLYFDLRQQFVEYRQKIEEVSVISQNLPEEMQKWHEKSSFLEKNQSIIYEKLNEIQIAIESLKTNFTKFAARADSRNEYSKDDKFVADLGAKLEAVASDMEIVKDHFTTVQKNQSSLQEDIDKLGVRFSNISNHIPEKNKDEDLCLQKVQNLQTRYENEFKSVTANISVVNDTLNQNTRQINDELLVHKTNIDDSMDKIENITSHVSSIKNDWTKYKQQIVDCDAKVENFENTVSEIVNKTNILEKSLQEVRLNCSLSDGLSRNCINLNDKTPQTTKTELQQNNGLTVK